MAMSTLAQRLQKVQQQDTEPGYDFSHLSMEQLETSKIKFGKTHGGKTFNHMWTQEQKWVLWFTQHYAQSTKYDHRMFIYYVEKKIERCELTGVKMPTTSATEQSKAASPSRQCGAQPKAKALSAPTGQIPVEEIPVTTWDYEENPELFEVLPEVEPTLPTDSGIYMEACMASVENALARSIHYIEQNTTTLISEQ